MCIYCDYCVYQYKSTELVSLYTLDIITISNFNILLYYIDYYGINDIAVKLIKSNISNRKQDAL